MARFRLPPRPLRSADFPRLAESFLVAAVVAVLGIRAALSATGFPRLGGGELHIAHLLPGGALMLVGVLLLIAFLDRRIGHVAVILAGLGFGLFIDEIGKYVTTDNDYLFQPAIALIYVVFILVFFLARALAGEPTLTRAEALANALDRVARNVGYPFEEADAARVRELLDQAGAEPIAAELRRLVAAATVPDHDDPVEVVVRWARTAYVRVVEDDRFERVVTLVMAVYAGAAVVTGIQALLPGAPAPGGGPDVTGIARAASSLVGAAFVLRGVTLLPVNRAAACEWLMRGLLAWILVTQVFVFYASQLEGVVGLAFDLVAYVTVRYALGRERAARRLATAPATRASHEATAAGG